MAGMRSPPPQRPASVMDFLHRHDGAAALLPAAERIVRLEADLLGAMPASLRADCTVTDFDGAEVTVRVSSASVAAKLRQTLPRLRETLVRRGWQVDGIRLRIRPRPKHEAEPAPWKSPTTPSIPAAGVDAFEVLGDTLDDTPLRAAVDRLVRRRRPASR